MTGEQALAGYTINAARAVGAEHERGHVSVGAIADLVLWQEDPSKVSPEDVVELPVLMTVARGNVVHQHSSV